MGNWIREINIDNVINRITDTENSGGTYSTPDVYGRILKYQMVLKDMTVNDEEDLPAEVLRWRGIITLLALKDCLQLDILIKKVPLPDISRVNLDFAIAMNLTPKFALPEINDSEEEKWDWNWNQFYVIQILDEERNRYVDIALFSPETLIFPVAEVERKMPGISKISWFNEKFMNPAKCLKKEQKIAVIYWLKEIDTKLRSLSQKFDHGAQIFSTTLGLIENYKKALSGSEEKLDWCSLTDITDNNEIWNHQGSDLLGAKDFINKTVKIMLKIGESEVSIHDVFSDDIYCIKRNSEDLKDSGEEPFRNCRFADKYLIAGGEDDSNFYAFLPFGEKFIKALSGHTDIADNIMKVFSMRLNEKKEVIVQINFSQIYENGIDLTHEYSIKDIDWAEQEISLALWPGIFSEDWKRYFIYFDKNVTDMQICFPQNIATEDAKRNRCDVYQCNSFPKAIGMRNQNNAYVGAVFPGFKKEINKSDSNKAATVCVDFGTSRTIAYAEIESAKAQEISFMEEGTLPLLLKNNEGNKDEIAQNFIPVLMNEKKMYSIYKKFDKAFRKTPRPVLDGIIYMAGNMEIIADSDDQSEYLTNIKWMTDSDRGWFVAFLQQLCMQITLQLFVQGVGNIDWKYAVPLSLSEDAQNKIRLAWSGKIKEYLDDLSVVVHNAVKDDASESQAVSCFFYYDKMITDYEQLYEKVGYIAVDIGGGSTDFSLWKKERGSVMWETSAPLAGRAIFSERAFQYIQNFINVLDKVQDKTLINQMESIKKLKDEQNYDVALAFFERLIGDHYNELQRAVSEIADDDNRRWISEFRTQIALGAAMILFSSGQIVGEAIEEGEFLSEEEGTFYIVLAGNGANLFDWIYNSRWSEITEEESRAFVKIFLAGVMSRITGHQEEYDKLKGLNIRIVKSPSPKKEVAKGLFKISERKQDERRKLGHKFCGSDVIQWKNIFLDSFNKYFKANGYYVKLFGNSNISSSPAEDKGWKNMAERGVESGKDCCNIMMDILNQLYNRIK